MKTSAVLDACHTLEEVIELINNGGSAMCNAEETAGEYAWEAAKQEGFTDNASLEGQLEILVDAGAKFNLSEALERAIAHRNASRPIALTLDQHINENFQDSQKAFAEAQGVKPQQVTQWLNKDFIVVDGVLYAPRRELETG